jgi:hypothetical protein
MQGLIDPDQHFNRDRDRIKKFSRKVRQKNFVQPITLPFLFMRNTTGKTNPPTLV